MGMIYRFGQLFNVVDGDRGKNYPKDCDFSDKGYCLFLNAGNVTKNGWSFENNSFITEEKDQLLHNGRLTRENTVFTTRGTVGNAAYYGENIPFEHIRINSGMVILSSKDTSLIQNKFIYYLVTSPYAKKTIEMFCSGSAQPQLPIKDFVKIKFNLPSIEHQQKITYILSAYDNLIDNNNKRIKILEQMAENLYKEWFVRFRFPDYQNTEFENSALGKIPKTFSVVKMKDVIDDYIGGGWGNDNPDKSFSIGAYVIRGTDFPNIKTGNISSCPFRYHKSSNYTSRKLKKDDIIIEVSGGTAEQPVGRTIIITEDILNRFGGKVICASFCKMLRLKTDIVSPMYLIYWMNYLYQSRIIDKFQLQSTGIINFKFEYFLRKGDVLLPPQNIMIDFANKVEKIKDQINKIAEISDNLIKQRDMLLPRLMSGKLEV